MKKNTLNNILEKYGKPFIVIIIFAFIGALVMGGVAKKKKTTTYTATRQIVIAHNISEENQRSNSNSINSIVNDDTNMMPTYKDIAENGIIANRARTYLSKSMKKKYSTADIENSVSAKVSPQSLVMDLKVKTSSASDSAKIVNSVANAMRRELPRLQPGSGQVTLLQKANIHSVNSDTKPSVEKYIVVGLALGGLLGLIIEFVIITIRNFKD